MNNLKAMQATLRIDAPCMTVRKTDCGEYRVTFTLEAIRAAYPAMSRNDAIEKAESLAAYESDIESAYSTALAMFQTGLGPIEKSESAKIESIEIKMGWNDCLHMLLTLYEGGNAKGRKYALDELRQMAMLADKYAESMS